MHLLFSATSLRKLGYNVALRVLNGLLVFEIEIRYEIQTQRSNSNIAIAI